MMPLFNFRFLIILIILCFVSCNESPTAPANSEIDPLNTSIESVQVTPDLTCTGLYGLPSHRSGVDDTQCNTQCLCATEDRTFQRPSLEAPLFDYRHSTPWPLLGQDPYQIDWVEESDSPKKEQACVLEIDHEQQTYRLETMNLDESPPAYITHLGACGACSSLQDLKVYLQQVDLTDPVRNCGLRGISSELSVTTTCLEEIGFTEACAEIWAYNTKNTRESCLNICLEHLQTPYVDESGMLNPCLQCDEDQSGPVFKKIAGRTRRNSGLASAICRPCNSVSLIFHSYLNLED